MSKKILICLSLLAYSFACSSKPAKVQFSKGAKSLSQSSSKDLVGQLKSLGVTSGKFKVVEDKQSLDEIVLKCRDDGEDEEFPTNNGGDEEFPEDDGFPDDEFPENNGGNNEFPENNGGNNEFPEDDGFPDDEFPENNGGDDEFPEDDGFPDDEFPENNGGDDEFPENNGGDDEFPENNGGDEGAPLPGIECNDDALSAAKDALINLIKPLFVFLSEEQVQQIVDAISSAIPDTCESNLAPVKAKVTAAIVAKDSSNSAILVDSSGQMKKVKLPAKLVKKLLK